MKIIKRLTIHPKLGDNIRQEVHNWCTSQFGDNFKQDVKKWLMTSNCYNKKSEGTFDMVFTDMSFASHFLLKWGGEVVNKQYDEVFSVDQEVFNNLFIEE